MSKYLMLSIVIIAIGCHAKPAAAPSNDDHCFNEHSAAACLMVAAQSVADPSVTTPQRGREAAAEACRLKRGDGCEQLAEMLESGRGGARALDAAVADRRQGCALGDAIACEQLGNMLSSAIGASKDDAGARDAYAKGCAAQRRFSCARLLELPSGVAEPPAPVAVAARAPSPSNGAFSLAVIGSDANPDKEQRCREQLRSMGAHLDAHAGTKATLILGSENRLRVTTRNEGTVVDRELSHAGMSDLCAEMFAQVARTQKRRAGL
ncbi:MAG TPA: hypothetical protein VIA18_25075 [Polyangia bacterium]|jgi:hypothetical protein|nr:hypothetical protein [Polyangia bacterium]